jgi:two-component system, cell cycle response regulator DivK
MLEKETVDHIIIDLEMPNMDGYELTKLVKEKHPKIFITISTGSIISQDNIDLLLSNGVLGFLYKPTSKVELLNHIRCIQSLFPKR